MASINQEDAVIALSLIEAITYGKIKDNIIYDLTGNPVFNIVKNEANSRRLELIQNETNKKYKTIIEKFIGKEKDIQ